VNEHPAADDEPNRLMFVGVGRPATREEIFAFVAENGVAGQVYGSTRVAKDLDLCPAWSAENLERVAAALRDLGARMKIGEGSIELLEVALDAKTLANMEIVPWANAGRRRRRTARDSEHQPLRARVAGRHHPLQRDRGPFAGSRCAARSSAATSITKRTSSRRPSGTTSSPALATGHHAAKGRLRPQSPGTLRRPGAPAIGASSRSSAAR
jgi:hypothetical protein